MPYSTVFNLYVGFVVTGVEVHAAGSRSLMASANILPLLAPFTTQLLSKEKIFMSAVASLNAFIRVWTHMPVSSDQRGLYMCRACSQPVPVGAPLQGSFIYSISPEHRSF